MLPKSVRLPCSQACACGSVEFPISWLGYQQCVSAAVSKFFFCFVFLVVRGVERVCAAFQPSQSFPLLTTSRVALRRDALPIAHDVTVAVANRSRRMRRRSACDERHEGSRTALDEIHRARRGAFRSVVIIFDHS